MLNQFATATAPAGTDAAVTILVFVVMVLIVALAIMAKYMWDLVDIAARIPQIEAQQRIMAATLETEVESFVRLREGPNTCRMPDTAQ